MILNELEYYPQGNNFLYLKPDLQPGDVFLAPRGQCDDLVLIKNVARVHGGDSHDVGEGRVGAASVA